MEQRRGWAVHACGMVGERALGQSGGGEKQRYRGNLGSLRGPVLSALLCSSAVLQRGGKAIRSPISWDRMKP